MTSQIRSLGFFYRPDNKEAIKWEQKIKFWLKQKYPTVKITGRRPQAVLVLGGDGTILEAARKFQKSNSIIFGLNLGRVGFLASAREPKKFLNSLSGFLAGKYSVAKRMMITSSVFRKGRLVFAADSLNDITIQNLLGMVELEIAIEGHKFQNIRGTGVLVSTATGSTAYNLSAHGPILMPDIKAMVLTELMDHNIPTPSVVIKKNREVAIKVVSFRERGLLSITGTNQKADVLLVSDGEKVFPLQENDVVKIKKSQKLIKFAEVEKSYFFKSLEEKFSFR